MKIKYYFFLFVTCIIFSAFAEPPPLPISESFNSNSLEIESKPKDSKTFFNKIKSFFGSEKPPQATKGTIPKTASPVPLKDLEQEIDDDKPFIDIGDAKLPVAGKPEEGKVQVLDEKNPMPNIQALENVQNDQNVNKDAALHVDTDAPAAPSDNKNSIKDTSDIDDIVIPTLPDNEPETPNVKSNQDLPPFSNMQGSPPPLSRETKVEDLKAREFINKDENLPNVENVNKDLSGAQKNLNNDEIKVQNEASNETQPNAIKENQQNSSESIRNEQIKKDTSLEEKKPIINIPNTPLNDKSISEVPATYPTIATDEAKNEDAENLDTETFKDDFKVPDLDKFENENDVQKEEKALVEIEEQKQEDPLVNLQEFINNETKMLLLPNDETVLGITSLETDFKEMDFYSYLKQFRIHYKSDKTQKYLAETQKFISTYYNIDKTSEVLSPAESVAEAYESVRKGDLRGVKVVIDNYNLPQVFNSGGKGLPEIALIKGDYFMTKYLLIKGFNAPYVNEDDIYSISKINKNIYLLINSIK